MISKETIERSAKVALVSMDSLGDGLIYLMMAENLRRNHFNITLYGDIAYQLRHWLPQLNIQPYPAASSFSDELDAYDLVLMSPPSFIRRNLAKDLALLQQVKRKWVLICQKAPEQWHFDHTAALSGTLPDHLYAQIKGLVSCGGSIRYKRFKSESVVDITLAYMREKMQLPQVSAEVQLNPLAELVHRKHTMRVIVSPDSNGPEQKNWSASGYIKLCHRLRGLGYTPVIVVAPKHHLAWSAMPSNCFATPLFDDIHQLACYLYESAAVIANDSGNGHLASFLNIPVVTIYRKRNPSYHWRPAWRSGKVVCPKLVIPWFSGTIWKPFVTLASIVAALQEII